jgi:DNA polymerase V
MSKRVIALADLNNAFVAMERIFDPRLHNVPVVTASNNDSMIIARSYEAKALGIKMAQPYFQVKHFEKQGLVARSANFPLYSNISSRFVATLESFSDQVSQYSVDECFFILNKNETLGLEGYAKIIKETLYKHLQLPAGIGISSTKTLSKLANYAAKKYPATGGIVNLYGDDEKRKRLLAIVPVGEVWGCGKATTKKLLSVGVTTALELANLEPARARDKYGINLFKTINELNGIESVEFEPDYSVSQSLIASRSLGEKTDDKAALLSSIAAHVARATLKLRDQGAVAKTLSVSIQTSLFVKNDPSYSKEESYRFSHPISDSRQILREATRLFENIYRPGYRYSKTGIRLSNIVTVDNIQDDLFASANTNEKSDSLMSTIDSLNSRFGKGTLKMATESTNSKWTPQSSWRSPNYTGSWDELPVVKC